MRTIVPIPVDTTSIDRDENSTSSRFLEEIGEKLQKISDLPHISLIIKGISPSFLTVRIVAKKPIKVDIEGVIKQTIAKALYPDETLYFAMSQYREFILREETYFFFEGSVPLKTIEMAAALKELLPQLEVELKNGVQSGRSKSLLSDGHLTTEPADELVLKNVVTVMQKRPNEFDDDLLKETHLMLYQFPVEFKQVRTPSHLCRVICSLYIYNKSMCRAQSRAPMKRHIYMKTLKTQLTFPFGKRDVVGIALSMSLQEGHEILEESHIQAAISNIVPQCLLVKGSYLLLPRALGKTRNFYFELERSDRKGIAHAQLAKIKRELPEEIKTHIEHLMPKTFMRRNEEEVFRNIVTLREQLKYVADIPQVTITFEEQTHRDLFFTVILLRNKTEGEKSVESLFTESTDGTRFVPDRVDIVGKLRGKYLKEANVFRLVLPKTPFLRKDRSVDLYRARQHVVNQLDQSFGRVRDYNGGLILKQDERLKDFMSGLEDYDQFLMENFFYAITPIAMQGILSSKSLKRWFLLLASLLEQEREEAYHLAHHNGDDYMIVMLRSDETSLKERVMQAVDRLEIPSTDLASSSMNVHGTNCFGFLLLKHHPEFLHVIETAASEWKKEVDNRQHLRINVPYKSPTLDPRITRSDNSNIIVKMLYEGLTRIGTDRKPHPAIAESIDVSEDGMVYTFTLRDSKWSDGSPITAHDFEYSWKKILENGEMGSILSYTLHVLKNAKKAHQKKVSLDQVGICAKDAKTLIVELEYPVPYFLELTAHWTYLLINSRIDKLHPGWAHQGGDTFVSNGPFKLQEWKHNQEITLVKNPHYWDADQVKLEKITISMMDNPYTELQMFENGEIDMTGVGSSTLPEEKLISRKDCISHPLAGVYSFWFNVEQFPFNNRKLRRALSLVIDRKKLSSDSLVATSVLPRHFSLFIDPLFEYGNIKEAKALFDEALIELGLNLQDFPPILLNYSTKRRERAALLLKKTWEEVFDIPVLVVEEPWGDLYSKILEGKHQVVGMAWYSWFWDPNYILSCFASKTNQHNASRWENAQYAKLIKDSNLCLDQQKRREILAKAESLLIDEMPVIPLFQCSNTYLKKPYVRGLYTSELFETDFKWAYIQKDE